MRTIIKLGLLLLFLLAVESNAQNDPRAYLYRYLQKTAVDDSLSNYGINWSGISTTTGTFTTLSATSVGAHTLTGSATATDSTTSIILKDSGGVLWKIRVYTNGALVADSTGLN